MAPRLSLHALLKSITGVKEAYFQPPADITMVYPCIVYRLDDETSRFANNFSYFRRKRYLVTVIDRDPDSLIPDRVGSLPMCIFDRHFTANNLNHYAYKIFF